MRWTISQSIRTNSKIKLYTLAIAASFVASLVAVNAAPFIGLASAIPASTVTVTGDTAADENQPGWLFNRDVSTSTPYEFNTDAASVGNGSLYVQPIGANASDKFIAENFLLTPVADVDSVSYDFKIGAGGDASDKAQFYMSVYANFGSSSATKFYDCRYSVVPATGSTAGFTTVTFDPTQNYPVAKSGSSPFNCPAAPADMDTLSSGSTIRAFSLNVGDTSTSDLGLDGYLDNVVVSTASAITIYDLDPARPSAPTNGAPHNTYLPTNEFDFTWDASTGGTAPLTYEFQSSLNPAQSGGVLITGLWHSGVLSTPMIHSSGAPDGKWFWQVRAKDADGLYSDWSQIWNVTLDHTAPTAPVLIAPTDGQYFTTTPILNDWTASTDDNGIAKYQVEYIYDDGHTFAGGPYREISGSQTQRNHTPNTSEQGGVKVRVRAFDPAGNTSDWSNQVHYFYDATAPSTPTQLYPGNNAPVKGDDLVHDWSDVADAHHYVYQSYNVDGSGDCNLSDIRFTGNYTDSETNSRDVADLVFCWRVKAVDAAGNESAWSPVWKTIVDNTAPDVFITSPAAGFINGPVEIRATLIDDNPHHYFLRIERQTGPSSWTTVFSKTYNDPSAFTDKLIHDWTPSTDGVYRITFEARDAAGGTSSSGNKDAGSVASLTVTVDTTGPVVTIDPIADGPSASRFVTGTLDDTSATLTVEYDGVAQVVDVESDGSWTVHLTSIDVGPHTVTAYATDAAGNTTTPAAEETFERIVPGLAQGVTTNTPNNPQNNQNKFNKQSNDTQNDQQEVLAATTSDSGTPSDEQNGEGDTPKEVEQIAAVNNKFLGLGWWWLAVVALVVLLTYLLARRRSPEA